MSEFLRDAEIARIRKECEDALSSDDSWNECCGPQNAILEVLARLREAERLLKLYDYFVQQGQQLREMHCEVNAYFARAKGEA